MSDERTDPQPDKGRDDEAHAKEQGEGLGPPPKPNQDLPEEEPPAPNQDLPSEG